MICFRFSAIESAMPSTLALVSTNGTKPLNLQPNSTNQIRLKYLFEH